MKQKQNSTYKDNEGWTHILKSKGKYKEKHKKNENMDELINKVIKVNLN